MAPHEQRRLLLLASYSSVGVALLLILLKTLAWLYTGSASLLGSLLDSVMDSMASIITMLAVHYSLKPADDAHRFGHGKAESLAALAQAGFILATSVLLFLYCASRLLDPRSAVVENTTVGLAVTMIAIVCTLVLLAVQGFVVRQTGSQAISADRLHYRSDLLLNLSVIAALLFARYGMAQVDLLLGLAIALYIGKGACTIGIEAFGMLMDRELPEEVDRRILALASAHEGVLGVHDLRTRRSGMRYVIQLHLEMADEMPLWQAHRIADAVEDALLAEFAGADILIHQDPHSVVVHAAVQEQG